MGSKFHSVLSPADSCVKFHFTQVNTLQQSLDYETTRQYEFDVEARGNNMPIIMYVSCVKFSFR